MSQVLDASVVLSISALGPIGPIGPELFALFQLFQLFHGSSYFLIIREDVTGEGDYGEVDPVKKASDTVRWVGPLRWGFGTRPA